MQITRFSRIDTVTMPGRYLSVVRVADGEGCAENVDEVANTVRGDRDSIDAVMFLSEDSDAAAIPGIGRLIDRVRPARLPVILVTSGGDPAALDELVGEGCVNEVLFRYEERLGKSQIKSLDVVQADRVPFSAACVLDPGRFPQDDVLAAAELTEGHREFLLLLPRDPLPCYRKRDLNALSKALRGRARGVRALSDFRTPRGPGRRWGSGPCCSR